MLANKWDLVHGTARDVKRFRDRVRGLNPGFTDLPLLCVSATTGEGLDALFNQIAKVEQSYRATVTTPVLNRALQAATTAHHPPSPHGRAVKFYYATQTAVAPPEFTLFTNAPDSIPPDYTRYLGNRFAEAFALVGVGVRIRYRPRRKDDVAPTAHAQRGTAARSRHSSRQKSGSARARPR